MTSNVRVLRQGHIEEDSIDMQDGERFVLANLDGSYSEEHAHILYEKGDGHNLWGPGYRVVGLNRLTDVHGTPKICISIYGDVKGKTHWDVRGEVFPTSDTSLSGLLHTERMLPYHVFLSEHGWPLEDI